MPRPRHALPREAPRLLAPWGPSEEPTDVSTRSPSTGPLICAMGSLRHPVAQQLLTTFSKPHWLTPSPWFRASTTNPPTRAPLRSASRPGPASPGASGLRVVQPLHPAFAHPPVPGRSQSQQTGEFPFGCVKSWCRRPSSRGPRGAPNPPWGGLESLGARSNYSLARGFGDAAHPAVLPAVWPGRGPPGRRSE